MTKLPAKSALATGRGTGRMECSIIVPFYNEQDSIEELYRRLMAVMDGVGHSYEMIFVNDGSTDRTDEILHRLAKADTRITAIRLRRNFGQTAALAAGFDHAQGEVIITMDGDLQHAPEDIPKFTQLLSQGYDLVSGWRAKRVDNFWLRRLPSAIANRMMSWVSGVKIHDFGTTFKAYRKDIIEHIRLYGEMHRFIPALAAGAGARIAEVPIQNIVRPKGKSSYGLGRTLRVLMDIITVKFLLSYFTRPLHMFGLIGLASFAGGAGIAVFLIIRKILGVHIMEEHAPLTMLSVLLIICSLIFFITGLLGEMIARTYYESQGKRIYTVSEIYRAEDDQQQEKQG